MPVHTSSRRPPMNFRAFALLVLALLSWPALGQESWYEIELLVFAYPSQGSNEVWPRELGLRYPAKLRQLTTASDAPVDEVTATDASSEANTITEGTAVAYQLLPQGALKLGNAARQLQRGRGARTLFHGSWLQPLTTPKRADYIRITGGKAFEQSHELDGAIKLSLDRYLFLETDLWLSRFVNAGTVNDPWPLLPRPPRSALGVDDLGQALGAESVLDSQAMTGTAFGETPNAYISSLSSLDNLFSEQLDSAYDIDRTVVLREHRRLRSNELHYLDHPLFGVLVRISPADIINTAPQ